MRFVKVKQCCHCVHFPNKWDFRYREQLPIVLFYFLLYFVLFPKEYVLNSFLYNYIVYMMGNRFILYGFTESDSFMIKWRWRQNGFLREKNSYILQTNILLKWGPIHYTCNMTSAWFIWRAKVSHALLYHSNSYF